MGSRPDQFELDRERDAHSADIPDCEHRSSMPVASAAITRKLIHASGVLWSVEILGSRNGRSLTGQLLAPAPHAFDPRRPTFAFQRSRSGILTAMKCPKFARNGTSEMTLPTRFPTSVIEMRRRFRDHAGGGRSSKVEFRAASRVLKMTAGTPRAKTRRVNPQINRKPHGAIAFGRPVCQGASNSLFEVFVGPTVGFVVMRGSEGALIPDGSRPEPPATRTERYEIKRRTDHQTQTMGERETILSLDRDGR